MLSADNRFIEFVTFRNLGNGNAINLQYSWECRDVDKKDIDAMPILAIQKGDSYTWQLDFETSADLPEIIRGIMTLYYTDLLGYPYKQTVSFGISNNDDKFSIFDCSVSCPVLDQEEADRDNKV